MVNMIERGVRVKVVERGGGKSIPHQMELTHTSDSTSISLQQQ